jgi:hypothetical protein
MVRTYPDGQSFRIPPAPIVVIEVPSFSYRLAMLGDYVEAFELVFDYSNLRIDEFQCDDNLNLFGVFETPKGFTRLPLIREFFGDDLQRLADAVRNNIQCTGWNK